MKNEFALELKKQKVITDYRDALISAINFILKNIENQKEFFNSIAEDDNAKIDNKKKEEFQKSIERYSSLKGKIENNAELSKADYSLLSIVCTGVSNSIASEARKLLDSAEQLKNLAKAFII